MLIISTTIAYIEIEIWKSAYLINLLVRHRCLIWNVLPGRLDVHISFDAAWSNGVDSDALVAEVYALESSISF